MEKTGPSRMGRMGRMVVLILSFLCYADISSFAAPLYTYREADGTIHFTSHTPPSNVGAKIFTGRSGAGSFSFYSFARGNAFSRISSKQFQSLIQRYDPIISNASRSYHVDAALLKAVIHAESAFNSRALSKKGAIGLMQLMPGTARELGVQPHDEEDNIHGGAKHLAGLVKRFSGNLAFAIAAYNAGEEAVRRYNGIPPFEETRNYVRRVLSLKDRYTNFSRG